MTPTRRTGAAGVLAALFVVAVYGAQRIPPIDVPWHLATGRLIVAEGIVPVTNTFSWTFPDHPLTQQYPLYQAAGYLLLDRWGWEALSVANLVCWLAATFVWLRWAGTLRTLAAQPLVVVLVCLGVQRHLLVRPEVCTLLGLGALLLLFDMYRAGRTPALLGVAPVQWAMAMTHQLWILGVAVQALFLVHLLTSRSRWAGRAGLSVDDAMVPLGPPIAALVGSAALLAVSPLGVGVFVAPLAPLLTLWSQGAGTAGGAQAQELALVFTDPLATLVVVVGLLAGGVALARSRGHWSVLELGVFALGFAMVAVAVRGIPFFAVATGGLLARTRTRTGPALAPEAPLHRVADVMAITLAAAIVIPGIRSEPRYGSTQLGFGRSVGDWGDGMIGALERRTPRRILNLGWVAGNPLAFAGLPVFVDPRFEAYPKPFLARAIAAETDVAALRALIAEYAPNTVVAEMRKPAIQQRMVDLVADGWVFVHLDALFAVLVDGRDPEQAALAIDPSNAVTGTDAPAGSVLLAQDHLRLARLLLLLGKTDAARTHLEAAAERIDDPAVAAEQQALYRTVHR